MPDETDTQDASESTALAVRNDPAPLTAETQFAPASERAAATTSREAVGRTAYDLLQPFMGNPRFMYLFVLLLVGLVALATGNLKTWGDCWPVAGLTVVTWIILWVVQRR
jgi:hypothetical protein